MLRFKSFRPLGAIAGALAIASAISGCGHGMSGIAATPTSGTASQLIAQGNGGATAGGSPIDASAEQVCAPVGSGLARCLSFVRTDTPAQPQDASPDTIFGYHPKDLVSAYKLPSTTRGAGQTIAIVDAYDDPITGANLAHYRATFGLPACTRANGCYKKVNQNGFEGDYPSPDTKWAEEISLDVDMASAICPKCHILLVEANSNAQSDLAASVDMAVHLGANVVSNSYGGSDRSQDSHYNHPGHIITASTGDDGYAAGTVYPSASRFVVAVGGTRLVTASNSRGWSESVWRGAGSGCTFEPKPSWQHDTGCPFRTVADTAAVADPATGVAVYDTYNKPGWMVFGGTSVSSPIIAGVYALAGNESRLVYARGLYRFHNRLNDVTTGSNGSCFPLPAYLCHGEVGYDGPTGNGTPDGIGGF